jgi:hypothetical protein
VKHFRAPARWLGDVPGCQRVLTKTATARKQELMMIQSTFERFFTKQTLIGAAFALVSLGGVAHAQDVRKVDPAAASHSRPAPILQGNDYNFMEGGGG